MKNSNEQHGFKGSDKIIALRQMGFTVVVLSMWCNMWLMINTTGYYGQRTNAKL